MRLGGVTSIYRHDLGMSANRHPSMASSSGDDETSVESLSPVSVRPAPRKDPAFAPCSASAVRHGAGGSAAQPDRGFPQKGEWIQYKSVMRRIYVEENRTLTEVREHMRINYGFTASWVYH